MDRIEWREHSAFRYVATLRFVDSKRFLGIVPHSEFVASSPDGWFAWLKQRAVSDLKLVLIARRRWAIQTTFTPDRRSLWHSKLRYARSHTSGRVWDVTYSGKMSDTARSTPGIRSATATLRAALDAAAAFSRTEKLFEWTQRFLEARAALDLESVEIPFHPDLLASPSSGARRLAAASVKGWVMGGAGSWTDVAVGRSSRETYTRITTALSDAVLQGVAAAANAEA
jgi:hypothetical protein